MFTHLVLASLLLSVALADSCLDAWKKCDLHVAGDRGSVATIPLGGSADTIFTNRIIAKKGRFNLGIINLNTISPQFINKFGVAKDITRFASPRLTPTHFKPYAIFRKNRSAVGHQTFTGNQRAVSKGRCLRLFFLQYQILDDDDNVISNVNLKPEDASCVVFRTA